MVTGHFKPIQMDGFFRFVLKADFVGEGAWGRENLIQGEGSDSLKTALETRGKTA